jgi:hypothetical protein
MTLDENYFKGILKDNDGLVADLKGIFKGKFTQLKYWSL